MCTGQRGSGTGTASEKEQQLAPETINAAEHYAATASASGEGRVARQVRQGKYKITAVPNGQRKMEKKSQVAGQNNGVSHSKEWGKPCLCRQGTWRSGSFLRKVCAAHVAASQIQHSKIDENPFACCFTSGQHQLYLSPFPFR